MAFLDECESALEGIASAILQQPRGVVSKLATIVVGKATTAAAAGGFAGMIAMLGTASTGTAIASLSGAAAQSATLYWIGSAVGLGAVGGGVLLGVATGGLGLVAGLFAAPYIKSAINGTPRAEQDLQDHEIAVVNTCLVLIKSIREQRETCEEATGTEKAVLIDKVIRPLVEEIRRYETWKSMAQSGVKDRKPFEEVLVYLARWNLDSNTKVLEGFIGESRQW